MSEERIIPTNIEDEMQSAYLDYAISVIVSRSLPDVRDGLKPVHRRILYAMKELGLLHNKPYKKSATVVGEVIGKYHPHGDKAIYDSLVRMAQDFSLRYPLIDGQGNFGSIDGDSAAAYRYTEARLHRIAEEMLEDMDKDTVDFMPNFDGRLKEPVVLPAKFPQLLVNGTSGIAVGMATEMPPHNLSEVIDATIAYIDNPDITIDKLMKFVKAPDFPTGGIIIGLSGIKKAYETGKGQLVIRSHYHFEEGKKREKIVFTDIPYQKRKADIITDMANKVKEKKISGIYDIRDESDKEGIRIVVELKGDVPREIVLNQIFKHTALKTTYHINSVALVDGVPRTLSLKDLIHYFVEHRKDVVIRRTKYDLKKNKDRLHILEGLLRALDHIDEIIEMIKTSKDVEEAKKRLMGRFGFTDVQAQSILDMKLSRLTALERGKLEEEKKNVEETIEYLESILNSEEKLMSVIKDELKDIKKKYGDKRKTEIQLSEDEEYNMEDLIPDSDAVVLISRSGYIKWMSTDAYRRQSRGGKGVRGMITKENDFVQYILTATLHQYLMFFTSKGRVYFLKVYQIPEMERTSRGKHISSLLKIGKDETIKAVLPISSDIMSKGYILMATKNGIVKKTEVKEFVKNSGDTLKPKTGGIIGLKLRDNDEIIGTEYTSGDDEVILVTRNGMAIRFNEDEIRPMGRNAMGVKGITLKENDEVVSMVVVAKHMIESDHTLFVATDKGYGKRSFIDDYRKTRRGGKGIITIKTSEKNGNVVKAMEIIDSDELIFITVKGKVIRIKAEEIRVMGRNTQGVRIMKLDEDDKLTDVDMLAREVNDNEK